MWNDKPNAFASSSKISFGTSGIKVKQESSKDIKPVVSIKVELSKDDFDDDVQADVKVYSANKRLIKDQENVKILNRSRIAQGLKPIKAPKPEAIGGDADPKERFGTSRRKENTHKVPLEGSIILPGSPLHRLAGIPESEGMKYFSPATKSDPWSSEYDKEPPKPKVQMTMINGHLVKKPRVEPDSPVKREVKAERWGDVKVEMDVDVKPVVVDHRALGASLMSTAVANESGEDDEMECYEDSDDDDILIAPRIVDDQTEEDVKPVVKIEEGADADEDESGEWNDDDGDDELIAPNAVLLNDSHDDIREEPIAGEEPPYKPYFSMTATQALIGPLFLDPNDPSIAVPASINRFLRPYQQEGVRFFYKQYSQGRGGILGDDMGLGKTIQVIAFLSAIMGKTGTIEDDQRRKKLFRRGFAVEPLQWPTALIIVPASLTGNWIRELDTWGYFDYAVLSGADKLSLARSFRNGRFDIILSSYETLRDHVEAIKDLPFSTVIFDEAHRLKNPLAALTKAAKKVQSLCAFGLTGTLIQNRLDEMWSVLDYAGRGQVGTRKQWTKFIVDPIKIGHRLDTAIGPMVESIMRLYQLKNKILPEFYLRRDKRLIAHELPTKRDVAVFCPLAPDQIIAYKAILNSDDCRFVLERNDPCDCDSTKKRVRIKCCYETTPDGRELKQVIFPLMHGLQKTANHVALLKPAMNSKTKMSKADQDHLEMCAEAGLPIKEQNIIEAGWYAGYCGKWEVLRSLLEDWRKEEGKNKVLIFSNSVRLLNIVEEFIQRKLNYNCLKLTGDVSPCDRLSMVDAYQNLHLDNYIFLISTMAGGVGLNLTAANKVVILDPNWNPANDLQAMDRAFRIGQKRPVDVYRLIGEGTIEEIMYERQVHKTIRSKQINDGTFEARVHVGYDGATGAKAQGELFGIQNLFVYKEGGFMRGNLERVKEAEKYFMAEATGVFDPEAEEEEEEDFADANDDEKAAADANRKLRASLKRKNAAVVEEILEEDKEKDASPQPKKEEKVVNDVVLSNLKNLLVSAHNHNSAFGDSQAERDIYEAGLELIRVNPELAKKLKAFEIGAYINQNKSASSLTARKPKAEPTEYAPIVRPAKGNSKRKRQLVDLVDLSDDDE